MKTYEFEAVLRELDQMALDITKVMQGKGFWNLPLGNSPADDAKISRMKKVEKLGLVASEIIGEALEAVRKNPQAPSEHCPELTAEEEEIADAMIRLLDYAGYYNLRLGMAIHRKMLFNEGRPFMHGKTC